jgi:arginyl-tRNA synthetase
VYYVQYAFARSNAIFRKASESGIGRDAHHKANLDLLIHPEEIGLMKKMEQFPRETAQAALDAEPHRISHYLLDLAGDFHRYYYMGDRDKSYRVLCEDRNVAMARMALVAAVASVLRNGLNLLGVEAPERM